MKLSRALSLSPALHFEPPPGPPIPPYVPPTPHPPHHTPTSSKEYQAPSLAEGEEEEGGGLKDEEAQVSKTRTRMGGCCAGGSVMKVKSIKPASRSFASAPLSTSPVGFRV